MLVTKTSKISGITRTKEIDVTEEQMRQWKEEKALIQVAMPDVSPSDREFIMSGITEEEWEEYMRRVSLGI